jgi:uncharacterized protein YndB with AHSA1/START domain
MYQSVAPAAPPLPMPQAGTNLPAGTVQVSVFVPASCEIVWAALTRREEVANWFGDLSALLQPGGTFRLDFGDGDFFNITDVTLDGPRGLSYQWRFLGTGPRNAISWSIERKDGGSRVTVTDHEKSRGQAMVDELTKGWTDFLQRLQTYLATGRNSRYAWRREFDGAIELPMEAETAWSRLSSGNGQKKWLPWSDPPIAAGAIVTMRDGQEPKRLTMASVKRPNAFTLSFDLGCPQWNDATVCTLSMQTRPQGSLLVVLHNGWDSISDDESVRSTQRHRFGALWTQALHKALELVSS